MSDDGALQTDGESVSHGICPRCADNIAFQQGVKLSVYIESLDVPVLVVNGDGEVQAANSQAHATFPAARALSSERMLTGDVFECQYARLPEGCGRTIHCSGCAIRRAIRKTLESGEPRCIPATLSRKDPDHPKSVALTVTTVKQGDAVLLKLEYLKKRTPSRRK